LIFIGVVFIFFTLSSWFSKNRNIQPINYDYHQYSAEENNENISRKKVSTSTNRLIIPVIVVNMEIISSDNEELALSQGAWHLIESGTPDDYEGYKNMVIGGHRYLNTSGPNTFFNLDKLEQGDQILLYWSGWEYVYQVDKIYIVQPENVSILEDSQTQKLTLFTCNPLYSNKERLVVDAYPVE
jgi:sortase A